MLFLLFFVVGIVLFTVGRIEGERRAARTIAHRLDNQADAEFAQYQADLDAYFAEDRNFDNDSFNLSGFSHASQ